MTEPTPKPLNDLGAMAAAFTKSAQQLTETFGATEPERVERTGLIRTVSAVAVIIAMATYWHFLDDNFWLLLSLMVPAAAWLYDNLQNAIRALAADWAPANRIFTRETQKADKP